MCPSSSVYRPPDVNAMTEEDKECREASNAVQP